MNSIVKIGINNLLTIGYSSIYNTEAIEGGCFYIANSLSLELNDCEFHNAFSNLGGSLLYVNDL